MSRNPRLVDDLIPHVLDGHDHWWPCDYVRLARISPSWVVPVRRRLYQRPSLHSLQACRLLARTLSDNPNLLPLIKAVDIRPGGGAMTERDVASLKAILGAAGLGSITLGGDMAVRADRFLHALPNARAVTELHIDGRQMRWCYDDWCFERPASLAWDEVMATELPSLSKLHLSNIELDITQQLMPPSLRLRELSIVNVYILSGQLCQLSHNWSGLRSLTVVAESASDYDVHIRDLLDNCGSTLESLHYEVRDVRPNEALFDSDDLTPCPCLRSLRLDGLVVSPLTLSSIGRACHNLRELSVIGRIIRVTPGEWAGFLSSGALPALSRLVTPSGTHGPPFVRWSEAMGREVLEVCRRRGVSLACGFLGERV